MNSIWYGLRLPVVAAAAALVLCGCGGGQSDAGEAAPASMAQAGSSASDAGGSASSARMPGVAAGYGTKEAAAPDAKPADQIAAAPQDRSIIYTAEMSIRAKDVSAAADRAKQIVLGVKGIVAEERTTSLQKNSDALITFKIPANVYQAVLAQLGKDLGKRESLHQNSEDVTEQVADVDSRVKSATAALDQFRTLLTKAKTIGEVLAVEREISNREADLESQQARQKSLASQTSMATLTLTIFGPSAVTPKPKDDPSGFLGGLSVGWKALVSAVKTGLTVLGVLLPWIVVLAVLWLIVRVVLRRTRPRPATPPSIPASSPVPDPTPAPAQAKAEAGSKS